MREIWELPKPGWKKRLSAVALVLALVWAAAAIPLTIWQALRPVKVEVPAERPLSVMELAAVRYAGQALSTAPVTLSSVVESAAARLEVEETSDAARSVSYGRVRSSSGGQTADLIAVGDRVLLRGGSAFWSSVGVLTPETGWIEVGDRLGVIPFPLASTVSELQDSPETQVDTPAADATEMTFSSGVMAATFTDAGVTALTYDGRAATLTAAPRDARSRVAAVTAESRNEFPKLVGASGALTVSLPPEPAEAPATPTP